MHRVCADKWLAAGQDYWLGSRARLYNLPRDRELRYTIASALVVGSKLVENSKHDWLTKPLGKPLSLDIGNGVWVRKFERGQVVCYTVTYDGAVEYN